MRASPPAVEMQSTRCTFSTAATIDQQAKRKKITLMADLKENVRGRKWRRVTAKAQNEKR